MKINVKALAVASAILWGAAMLGMGPANLMRSGHGQQFSPDNGVSLLVYLKSLSGSSDDFEVACEIVTMRVLSGFSRDGARPNLRPLRLPVPPLQPSFNT